VRHEDTLPANRVLSRYLVRRAFELLTIAWYRYQKNSKLLAPAVDTEVGKWSGKGMDVRKMTAMYRAPYRGRELPR
jgi:hypothetical protein